ncbi:hypothetical protein ACWD6I_29835, partial [Streptomyces sp. NPDC002454]
MEPQWRQPEEPQDDPDAYVGMAAEPAERLAREELTLLVRSKGTLFAAVIAVVGECSAAARRERLS